MKIIDRLAEYIRFKGISLNAFDKSVGLSNGYIGKQITKRASIGSDILENIFCTYADLSIVWLMSGAGDMIKTEKLPSVVQESNHYYTGPPICEKCQMKDDLIKSQQRNISTLEKLVRRYEENERPQHDGQKRKAAS